jgi:regulator of sigma E protease
MLFTLVSFFVALGILITFHELGHYWVARFFGVRILKFSIGFGRTLIKRVDKNGTEWALSAIPLGGYVKMLDENDPRALELTPDSFQAQSVWRRFAIVAAGPVFNLILAVFFYTVINLAGTSEPAAIIAAPQSQTAASQSGLEAGDRIVAVNQQKTDSWPQVRWALLQALGSEQGIELDIDRNGQNLKKSLSIPELGDPSKSDPLRDAGLKLQSSTPLIRLVVKDGIGERSGLLAGDQIKAINDTPVTDVGQTIQMIQQFPDLPLLLKIEREGVLLSIPVVPAAHTLENGQIVGRIGIQLGSDPVLVQIHYGLFESIWRGMTRTLDTAGFTLRMMGKMLIGEISIKNLSGPVTIADYAGQTARIGWVAYVSFLAMVSISLGVLNLLPIPMLDGGHLLYYLYEIVRGKPPSARWVEIGQRAGLSVLASLMVLALFNDLTRIFT